MKNYYDHNGLNPAFKTIEKNWYLSIFQCIFNKHTNLPDFSNHFKKQKLAPTVTELLYKPKIIRPSNWREQVTKAYFEERNYLHYYEKSVPFKWRKLLKEEETPKPSFGL